MSLLVSRRARRELGLADERLPAFGRVELANFTAARFLARAVSAAVATRRPIPGSDLAALDLLGRVMLLFLERSARRRRASLWLRLRQHLERSLGAEAVRREVTAFAVAFGLLPPERAEPLVPVDVETLLPDLVLYWLERSNPAANGIVAVLHRGFEPSPMLARLLDGMERFLGESRGELEPTLRDDLLAPFRTSPQSLVGQLTFLRERWADLLGAELGSIQGVLDLAAEESAPRWSHGGAGPVEVGIESEGERRYSDDRDWMPELVLAAKNALVWLDQLSQAYGREIRRLDQIPDAELELLAGRGLTGLWLIGLWERSAASSEIKRRRGNPEAAASAYSLRAYRIAAEIGGEEALADLRHRAARLGIRLAADMVPNHMGLDSDWVFDHPDRFVQLAQPPYPAYSFTGPDLSSRDGITVQIEDHYYDGSDAAVVFRRHEHASSDVRFIYHGNDGTSTPWNDTAQLDYLQESTREAVMATILDVARRFSVIRFDAAMTLTKRHYQRLWHPQPGDAGAIPSRAEHGMTRAEFDRAMPKEFWREVVDRIAREAPDTLLLAEAFWLMEGYFVRTLGMHRVYNSAFMHMLRDRETGKFRGLLKETLTFDPEILRRYVNFMSNPDEEPAAVQFGDGDRYFGACAVLATLPGLPMFAHGQWDGLREKYGMEYRRAYHGELPHREVIDRHDREIAPLLAERARFAGVGDFRLYDFHDRAGFVNEDVLAYSNGHGAATVLVVFNNSPHRVQGRLDRSAPFRHGEASDDLRFETLGEVLGLAGAADAVIRVQDRVGRREYLQTAASFLATGLEVTLDGFQTVVLDGFETRWDEARQSWSRLAERLGGRGAEDLAHELLVMNAAPLRAAVWRAGTLIATAAGSSDGSRETCRRGIVAALGEASQQLRGVVSHRAHSEDGEAMSDAVAAASAGLAVLACPREPEREAAAPEKVRQLLADSLALRLGLVTALILEEADARCGGDPPSGLATAAVVDWPLEAETRARVARLAGASARHGWLRRQAPPRQEDLARIAAAWCSDDDLRVALEIHGAGGVEWLVRERLEELLAWRIVAALSPWLGEADAGSETGVGEAVLGWCRAIDILGRAAEQAGYRVGRWADEIRTLRVTAPETAPGPDI